MNLDPRQAATSEVPFPGPEVFYNYLPEVYVAKDRALGMATLTKGRHTLSFICVGKDPHSLGYKFGINDVVIEKVPDFPAIPMRASSAQSRTADSFGSNELPERHIVDRDSILHGKGEIRYPAWKN